MKATLAMLQQRLSLAEAVGRFGHDSTAKRILSSTPAEDSDQLRVGGAQGPLLRGGLKYRSV